MNEIRFGSKVKQALNASTRVEAPVAERLRAARERALTMQKPELSGVPGLAAAGGVAGRLFVTTRALLPLVVLLGGLLAIWGWQQGARVAEVEEIDTQLLTDELPPEAYLDKGFEAWLKKRSSF